MTEKLLLDEHVSRVFERVLRERGCEVIQAKDEFGERTEDVDLLQWCFENAAVLVTNNSRDFEVLHREHDHAGILIYRTQERPDEDPEGLARTVSKVTEQYDEDDLRNELVELCEWYDWLHQ